MTRVSCTRDIKPSNLLLDTRGTVWITDFGLAKTEDAENLTATGDIVGTLRYMPPEAFEGKADARSDIYSLGLTLYELLVLQPAFNEPDRHRLIKQVTSESPQNLRKLEPTIPRDLVTIIHKTIDRDPSHRYQSAQELTEDLQRYLDDEPIKARRISPVARFSHWCKRNPLGATVAALLLVGFLGSCAAAFAFLEQSNVKDNALSDLTVALKDKNDALSSARTNRHLAEAREQRAVTEAAKANTVIDLLQEMLASANPDDAKGRTIRSVSYWTISRRAWAINFRINLKSRPRSAQSSGMPTVVCLCPIRPSHT